MKVKVFSFKGAEVEKKIIDSGLEISDSPDVVIVLGGDGTLLNSERRWPGVPKIVIRPKGTLRYFMYSMDDMDKIIEGLKNGNYEIEEEKKIKISHKGNEFEAMNEFTLRNANQAHAIRFSVLVNGEKKGDYIGDGVVVATPFGSTGYYHSVSRSSFKKGIGIAFNNTTEKADPIVLNEDAKVEITLTRGKAFLTRDDDDNVIQVLENDKLEITSSENTAKIVRIK